MKVLIPIADGIEEMETIILQDILVRGGFNVVLASVHDHRTITASRGALITAHELIKKLPGRSFDLILLPGGLAGAQNLSQSSVLKVLLREHLRAHKYYGAICASPAVVLQNWEMLPSGPKTSHPSFKEQLDGWVDQAVVLNGKCYTSQGPGTAFHLGLSVIENVIGLERRLKVEEPLCFKPF